MSPLKHLYIASIFIFGTCFLSQTALAIQTDSGELAIYENWLSVQEAVNQDTTNNNSPIYDRLSEGYFSLYKSTNNIAYLKFSLYEAGRSKRDEIVNRLTKQEVVEVQETIDLLNNRILSAEFYSKQPFSYEDIYKFLIFRIPDSLQTEANDLLDYWLNTLPDTYQKNEILGAMKAQALVFGFDRLDDFQKIHESGKLLIKSHPFPNSAFSYNLFNIIAFSARVRGYYSDALKIYQDILIPLVNDLNYSERSLNVKLPYANTLFRIGNINAALEEYEYIYSKGIQNLDPVYRPALLNNLAISHLNSGRFDQYVKFQLEAFEIASQDENYTQQLDILKNLFNFYLRQNETELAFNYLNQALQVAEQNNLQTEVSSILLSLGIYERETNNNPQKALQHFHDALTLSKKSDEYQQQVNSYIDLSETYLLLDKYDQAENYIQEAINLTQSRDDERNYTQSVVRYGNILINNGRFLDAQEIMNEITENDLQQIPFYQEVLGYIVNIKILLNSGKITEANELSEIVIEDILRWLEESTDLQTGHMRMDDEFSEAFRLQTDILYKMGEYDKAIAVSGKLRNLSRSGFFNNPLLKSQILTEEQLIRDYTLSNRIEDLRSRYANANEEQRVYLQNHLIETVAERNRLQEEAFPNYRENRFEDSLPLAMDKLSSDQMVIYFSVFENQVFQFFITSNEIDMKAYPADDYYLNLLEKAVASLGHATTDLESLYTIYKTFFDGSIPEGIEHIYMIPDGILYRLPLEILPVNPVMSSTSYGSSTYFIENYSVSYLNTLSDLIIEKPETDYNYDMAGFGISNFADAGHPELPDLPFSPKEITNSAEKLNKFNNNRFFLDENSTESNFREVAGKAKILHLATHSKVEDENPLFSSLYLHAGRSAPGDSVENENDGIIHTYELFDLNLSAEMVFLSSCESGAGGYLKGSGILGFSRAFAYAGAQSLSINLWPIRDQTASEISLDFYEALNEGKNKAEALREARLTYLNNTNSDPYLWGAFVMYGNIDSPIYKNQFLAGLLLPGLIVTGIFIIALFVYQKKSLIKSWVF